MELGYTDSGDYVYDRIDVDDNVTFDGTLVVLLIDAFNPQMGNAFDLIDWGSYDGEFATLDLPGLEPGLVWNTTDLYNTGEISITGLLGDANNDSMVSADDYGSVQLNFGDVGDINILGDANLDGVVSADDYGSVQLHFGAMAGAGYVPVPEPATLSLLVIGGFAILRRRRFDGAHHGRK